ncbi:Leucine-rich repeat and guanylate kinase domain-containing protein [Trichoplax sp. H2]|nr:Leucine-rich repeat and guanylate kinase domain-containing protein [Trichoplax sp. H2]|eukprot:RDD47093.1 Leucine-rich repeat and guanylate kinase domain-containing protein [Trichoplax sp. H2]
MSAKLRVLLPSSTQNLDLKTPGSVFIAHEEDSTSETNILQLETFTYQKEASEHDVQKSNSDDDDSTLNEENAAISVEMIAEALSNYGRSPDGLQRVFLDVELIGRNLIDITDIAKFNYLQKATLSYNKITDLTSLSYLPHLVYVDVSHNELTKLLDFKPPTNLKYANFSHNKLKELGDLSEFNTLATLNLDYNQISEIQGLEKAHRLMELRIAHNNITKIQNLDNLHIRILDLGNNKIKKIENIETLKWLQHFYLANNFVRSLKGLQNHEMLETIDLEDNQIIDYTEIKYLKDLDSLRELNLKGNPVQSLPDYRLSMLYRIPWLISLDHKKALETEKVAAKNIFAPKTESVACLNFVNHHMHSFAQSRKLYDSTESQLHKSYPIIVFVGPSGSEKKNLMFKLIDEFPSNIGYCQPLTTRAASTKEKDLKHYLFVSEDKFEMQIKLGRFLQTCEIFGQKYGITRNSIEKIARRKLICLIHTNLQGALTLRCSHFKPRFLLLIPFSHKKHENRLRKTARFSDGQITQILASREEYINFNTETPGFFDCVINTDDDCNTMAYKPLRSIAKKMIGTKNNSPIAHSRISRHDVTTNGVSTHYFSHRTISESTGTNSTPISYFEPTKFHFEDTQDGQAIEEQEAPRPGTRGDYSIAYEKMKQMGFKPQSAPLQLESDDSSVYSEYSHKRPMSAPETVSDVEINGSKHIADNTKSISSLTDNGKHQAQFKLYQSEPKDNKRNSVIEQFNDEMKVWAEVMVDHEVDNVSTNKEIVL